MLPVDYAQVTQESKLDLDQFQLRISKRFDVFCKTIGKFYYWYLW